jgi:hypothetical protein
MEAHMIKTVAAYEKLQSVLGTRIVSRGRSLKIEGQPPKRYTQTLLLIPKAIAERLILSERSEHYVDRKSKEEFVALKISETKPRDAVRAIQPLPNPLMGPQMIIGQGVYHKERGWGFVQGPSVLSEQDRYILSSAKVRIVQSDSLSKFRYGQIVTQLELVEENSRLQLVRNTLKEMGTPEMFRPLQAVAATEEDSTRLLSCSSEGKTFVRLTATDASSGRFTAFFPENESVPIARRPAVIVMRPMGVSKDMQNKFEREFDAREPKS